jgi:rRNA maturation protein Nop10
MNKRLAQKLLEGKFACPKCGLKETSAVNNWGHVFAGRFYCLSEKCARQGASIPQFFMVDGKYVDYRTWEKWAESQ